MPDSRGLRSLPSVASLLASDAARALLRSHPRAVVVDALREVVAAARAAVGEERAPLSREAWTDRILSMLPGEIASRESLPMRRVINAAGIVVHTNLGRAPLPGEALAAVLETARGYSNLEFDLAAGERSSRLSHVEGMLRALTGAECAHVVNNNAAAVLLCLAGHARGREVIVSRGELVEIGGSFRIPDIMAESGARLVEVGTTNRTRLSDYENAVTGQTALLLKVHPSNFSVHGFTEEVRTADLARLGERAGIPVMEDQGSGALIDLAPHGIPGRGVPAAGPVRRPRDRHRERGQAPGGTAGGDHPREGRPGRAAEEAPALPGAPGRQDVPRRALGRPSPLCGRTPGAGPGSRPPDAPRTRGAGARQGAPPRAGDSRFRGRSCPSPSSGAGPLPAAAPFPTSSFRPPSSPFRTRGFRKRSSKSGCAGGRPAWSPGSGEGRCSSICGPSGTTRFRSLPRPCPPLTGPRTMGRVGATMNPWAARC